MLKQALYGVLILAPAVLVAQSPGCRLAAVPRAES